MSKKGLMRRWHIWIGVVFSLPLIITSISAVMLAFSGSYKNKPGEPQVNVVWLPGYSAGVIRSEAERKSLEIRASFHHGGDRVLIGTGSGLFEIKQGEVKPEPAFTGHKINAIERMGNYLLVASKAGLFSMELPDGEFRQLMRKEIFHIDVLNDTTIAVADNKSLYISINSGDAWETARYDQLILPTVKSLIEVNRPGTIPLHRLVIDLHTGKAFFGKAAEGFWIVVVGISMAFLSVTGVILWVRREKLKRRGLLNRKETKGVTYKRAE